MNSKNIKKTRLKKDRKNTQIRKIWVVLAVFFIK